MISKKKLFAAAFALLTGSVVVLAALLGVMCRKIAEFDRKHGSDVLANLSAAELFAKTNAMKKAVASGADETGSQENVSQEVNQEPAELKVVDVSYEGDDEIVLSLSERPDMDVVRNYVKAEPLNEGRLTFRYTTPHHYINKTWKTVPTLRIRGEFAYRTNVTLRVLKGFPLYGKSVNPDAEGSLKEDFVYTFRRNDKEPYVKFADSGRYLPPGGLGAIALEAMNTTNISVGIRRVEPHNVVQMLAREEKVYTRYSWSGNADDEETGELSGDVVRKVIPCLKQSNTKEKIPFPVSMKDGKPRNGIYLVDTYMADHPICEYAYSWSGEKRVLNPNRYRLVCVSDLGLSVRRWGKDGIGVWVTSLTTGKPVADAEITIYSSARIKVMEGVTDANGWCEPTRVDKGEMFALVAVAPESVDMTFMALRESMIVDETHQDGKRSVYLAKDECTAFLWTERGIYRHDEKIFVQGIFRNGARTAPAPFPIELQLVSPAGDVRRRERVMTDANGTIRSEKFSVPADLPSGVWTIKAVLPGASDPEKEKVFGVRKVKVEEFAPPQIRVKVEADETLKFPEFGFTVLAEHLFGGAAHNLRCEGAVVFEDVPFAPLSDPSKVSITPDKAFYRAGERPRLVVKSPFTGHALLSVMRDTLRYAEVIAITNATSEIVLRPVESTDAPNLNVYLSVVQGVDASAKRLAVRAHGQSTVCVRPAENEIAVDVEGKVDIGKDGSSVAVEIAAPEATEVVVALVDEAINLLTGEETPDPVGCFAVRRTGEHNLYDIYHRVLPVLGMDALKVNGVKTGGGFGAEMLSRVSPVPTRRFKPLALWQAKIPVVNGKASAAFRLPEFVGEVRVTAVAYNRRAAGSKSVQLKVSPKLVAMPDAPRFVAPQDRFEVSLPLYNRSGTDGRFNYSISANGINVAVAEGIDFLKGASTNIACRITAPQEPGELELIYTVSGFGETHVSKIHLPVRPAVAWRESSGVKRLAPGEKYEPESGRFIFKEYDSPLGDLARSLEWLCEYPYGCLEQTVSRVFPLISAGGILSGIEIQSKHPRDGIVDFGIKRVESMVREKDFTMWPDANYAPWDKEVSLYASHFLVASERAGLKVSGPVRAKVMKFLSRWAFSTNENAHALMAIGEYYRFKPPRNGERIVAWRKLELPEISEVKAETNGIFIARRFLSPEGEEVDINNLRRGEMIVAEIELGSPDKRVLSDLVIEDLFAGAFEPIGNSNERQPDWVMRSDARDDRMLVFSKSFDMAVGGKVKFRYPLRVVSKGQYTLPGVSVEAMYFPSLNARTAPCRINISEF